MNEQKHAGRIGARFALIASLVGVFIAYAIMAFFHKGDGWWRAITWLARADHVINMLTGALATIGFSVLFGKRAGIAIHIHKRHAILTGILTGLFSLWAGTFVGSLVGLFQEGLANVHPQDNPVFDYVCKPMFWATFFGIVPVILVGALYGRRVGRCNRAE